VEVRNPVKRSSRPRGEKKNGTKNSRPGEYYTERNLCVKGKGNGKTERAVSSLEGDELHRAKKTPQQNVNDPTSRTRGLDFDDSPLHSKLCWY